jgi:hypothetical protein
MNRLLSFTIAALSTTAFVLVTIFVLRRIPFTANIVDTALKG